MKLGLEALGLIAGVTGALVLFVASAIAYRALNTSGGLGALSRGQQLMAKTGSYAGALLVGAGFLAVLLASDQQSPIDRRLDAIDSRLDNLAISAQPTPTPTPQYATRAPIPVTPKEYPLRKQPECEWAGPASDYQQAGGVLSVYDLRTRRFTHVIMRVGDECTNRGIPTGQVVLKWRRWMLRATSERGASVAFMNLPTKPKKSVSAVTITSAPGYRTRIQRQGYGWGTHVGSTNLIPLKGVNRPEDCNSKFFRPEYLRTD